MCDFSGYRLRHTATLGFHPAVTPLISREHFSVYRNFFFFALNIIPCGHCICLILDIVHQSVWVFAIIRRNCISFGHQIQWFGLLWTIRCIPYDSTFRRGLYKWLDSIIEPRIKIVCFEPLFAKLEAHVPLKLENQA